MSLSSIVLPALTEKPFNVKEILYNLYSSSLLVNGSTSTELNLLAKKAVNYLNSRDAYLKWFGCHLVKVILRNPLILANHGSEFMSSLLKIIELASIPTILYNAAVDAILALCLTIRGKATLNREIVTPNLPNVISTIVKKLSLNDLEALENSVSVLSVFIKNNRTVFRPHANKYEAKLVEIIDSEEFVSFGKPLRAKIIDSFIVLSLVNKNPALQWRVLLQSVLVEFQSMIKLVFNDLLEINEDKSKHLLSLVESLAVHIDSTDSNIHNKSSFRLAPLSLDLNEISTLSQLTDRFNLLTDLINGFITTPLSEILVSYPLGIFASLAEIILNISTSIHGFKSDLLIGNANLKKGLIFIFFKVQINGLHILNQIVKVVNKESLVYFNKIAKLVEHLIPMKQITVNNPGSEKPIYKKVLDKEQVHYYKYDLLLVLDFTSNLLSILDKGDLHDFSFVLKVIDMTIIMVEKTSYANVLEKNAGTSGKKNKKSKHSVELSDFLADSSSLKIKPDDKIIKGLLKFYSTVFENVSTLSLTQLIKIQNFTLLHAMKKLLQTGVISSEVKQVFENFIVYHNANEKFSVLPIVVNLLKASNDDNNELVSLLMNPRFPIVNKRELIEYDHEEEDEDELTAAQAAAEAGGKDLDEAAIEQIKAGLREEITKEISEKFEKQRSLNEEQEFKRRKLAQLAVNLENNANIWSEKKKETIVEESGLEEDISISTSKVVKNPSSAGSEPVAKTETVTKVAAVTSDEKDDDNDDNSDFEIPDIEVDSSDDDK